MSANPSQYEMLIYGLPSEGAVVVGGSWVDTASLLEWSDSRALGRVQVSARIARKRTHVGPEDPLYDALSVQDGNLVIASTGAPRGTNGCSLEVEVPDDLYSVTEAGVSGQQFREADVGSAMRVNGEWWPIVGFRDNTTSRTLFLRMHPSVGATPLTEDHDIDVQIAQPLVRLVDRTLPDVGADVEPLIAGGMSVRPVLGRPDPDDDDDTRTTFTFDATAESLAEERRADDANRAYVRASKLTRSLDPNGFQAVDFSAEVTAGNVNGAATLFPAILDEFWTTWTGTVLDALATDAGFRWEAVTPRVEGFSDLGRVGRVSQSFRRTNVNDLAGVVDDPRIIGAEVTMNSRRRHVHGLAGTLAPLQVSVEWSAGVQLTGANAVTEAGLSELWERSVKPFLVARAQAIFGGVVVVFASGLPRLDRVRYRASGSLVLLILRSASEVISYSRTTSITVDERVEDDDIHDGDADTFVSYSPGPATVGAVSVRFTQLDSPAPASPGASNGLAGLPGGGVFFAGGAISVGVSGPSAGSPDDGALAFTPTPGDPSRFWADVPADGEWVRRRRSVEETPQFYGADVQVAGLGEVKVVQTVYTTAYRYRRRGRRDLTTPPLIRPATGGGGSGGVLSTRVREE